jgi:putative membrane protein
MIHLLVKWLVSAVSLLIVAYFVPGFHVRTFGAAMIAALVIGLVNGTLGALLRLVTWPLRILTLGLLTWFISACMILLSSKLVSGFEVDGLFAALIGSLLLAIVGAVLGAITGGEGRK